MSDFIERRQRGVQNLPGVAVVLVPKRKNRKSGTVAAIAKDHGVSWQTAWRWLNREEGRCAECRNLSEAYYCPTCKRRNGR